MKTVVIKFGGTSVSTKDRLYTICGIVKKEKKRNPVVVVSAIRGVTDALLSIATDPSEADVKITYIRSLHETLIRDIWRDKDASKFMVYIDTMLAEIKSLLKKRKDNKAFSDKIVSYGEIMSSFIVSLVLEQKGILALQVIASDLIVTDNLFGSAEFFPEESTEKIKKILNPLIAKGIVPVITGFIGATEKGEVTTLGRGGSDYSASIIGYCLNASEIQIWTDVDGIYTADPRIVKTVHLIPTISYKEASELASFGAKVLHAKTLKPVVVARIPFRVLNTLNPSSKGTFVTEKAKVTNGVTAISHKKKITLVNIYSLEMLHKKGFLLKVYDILARNDISVDLVGSSEVSESIVLDNDENLASAVEQISKFAKVTVKKDLGMVSLIGEGISRKTQTLKEIFDVLHKENILVHMISLGAIDINVSLVVKSEEVEKAVIALHKNFFTL